MTNLHAHKPMREHAYKNHTALQESIPCESVQREPTKAQPDTIAFTPVFPWSMWAFESWAKLMVKGQKPCCHVLNQRSLTP